MSFWDGSQWVAEQTDMPSRASGIARRLAGATAEAGLISVLVLGLIATSAFAAKGGGSSKPNGGGGTTFSGPVLVHDWNGNGAADYNDDITFNVSTGATTQPEVGLRCWQGSNWVDDSYVSYFNSWLSAPYFTLSSSNWDAAQPASCTARLFYYNRRAQENVLATLTFDVAP